MSSWNIGISKEFEKRFKSLIKKDEQLRRRILKAINKLKDNPYSGKPLSYDLKGLWSLRIGKYRIIYRIDGKKKIIWLISIGHRKEIYEKKSTDSPLL